jgi:hypothetical protein
MGEYRSVNIEAQMLVQVLPTAGPAIAAPSTSWLGLKAISSAVRRALAASAEFVTGSSQPAPPAERRFFSRPEMRFEARIKTDEGAPSLPVQGLNVHRRGALVSAKQPLVPGSRVFFHIVSAQHMGFAYVRHCTPKGKRYGIGLEFSSPLMRLGAGTWHISCASTGNE